MHVTQGGELTVTDFVLDLAWLHVASVVVAIGLQARSSTAWRTASVTPVSLVVYLVARATHLRWMRSFSLSPERSWQIRGGRLGSGPSRMGRHRRQVCQEQPGSIEVRNPMPPLANSGAEPASPTSMTRHE